MLAGSGENSFPGVNHFYRLIVLIELENDEVLETLALLGSNIDPTVRELVDHLVGAKQSRRIAGGDVDNGLGHLLLGAGCHLDIDPETNSRKDDGQHEHRNANARHAHAVGLQGDQLVVGGDSPKNEQERGEETPWNREGQRKREHQRHERKHRGDRDIRIIDQDVEQLFEEIAQHKHEAQDDDAEEGGRDHADADVPVDNLHQKATRFCAAILPAGETDGAWN